MKNENENSNNDLLVKAFEHKSKMFDKQKIKFMKEHDKKMKSYKVLKYLNIT